MNSQDIKCKDKIAVVLGLLIVVASLVGEHRVYWFQLLSLLGSRAQAE